MLYDDAEAGDNDGVAAHTVGGFDGREQKCAAYDNSTPPLLLLSAARCLLYNRDKALFP